MPFLLHAVFMLLLVSCGGIQPLPNIDATVEARVEVAKAAANTPVPTLDIGATVETRVETRVAEERAKAAEATVEAIVEATVQTVLTADNVLFPDAGLDAAIREALGKAVQDKITTKELAELVELNCYARGIRDLTGLEYATTLATPYLWNNQISDVSPLASRTNLTDLDLTGNPVDLNDIQALRNRGVNITIDD